MPNNVVFFWVIGVIRVILFLTLLTRKRCSVKVKNATKQTLRSNASIVICHFAK